MQTMRVLVLGALVAAPLFGALGCDVEDVGDVEAADPIEVDLEPAVGPQPPTPPIPPGVFDYDAIVRFHSGTNLTGAMVSRELFATGDKESESIVTYPSLSGSMPNGARSVRLSCGRRAARLVVYARPNSLPQISDWWRTGDYDVLECEPWQTTTRNISSGWANGVRSAHAMVMPVAGPHTNPGAFSAIFPGPWNDGLDEALADAGGERDGDPILTYRSSREFEVRQNLLLNHPACFERSAQFTLRVLLDYTPSNTSGPGRTVASVFVVDTYVDSSSWPDPIGCQGFMEDGLDNGAANAAIKLRDFMPTAFLLTGACRSHNFFVPRNLGDIDIQGTGAVVSNGCQ